MPTWKSDNVSANGITLHYYRTGGDKPQLVMAHGITDSGLCWTPLAQALEDDYDIILIDARGHGQSEAPDEGYSNAEHAADYAAAIQALDLDKPAAIGHSMGAATIAHLAAHYPTLVRGLVLEDPPWRSKQEAENPEQRLAHAERWRTQVVARKSLTPEQVIAEGRQEHPMWSDAEFGPWAEAKLQVSPKTLDYVSEPSKHWSDYVSMIQCPVLLLTGDGAAGAIVSPEVVAEVRLLNPRVQVQHIRGAGHNIRREQFAAYLAAVRNFLAGLYAEKQGPN